MMFLFNAIRAEVEPVPKKKGWYQLTGKNIERWTMDVEDTFGTLEDLDIKVEYDARIMGIHSRDPEIALRDPRFNFENGPTYEGSSFGVYTEAGRTYMLLAINQAEYVIFRFLVPHEAGDDKYDPMEEYRVAPPAKRVTAKKAASKKPPAKKATKK